jgi:hypothetical protein
VSSAVGSISCDFRQLLRLKNVLLCAVLCQNVLLCAVLCQNVLFCAALGHLVGCSIFLRVKHLGGPLCAKMCHLGSSVGCWLSQCLRLLALFRATFGNFCDLKMCYFVPFCAKMCYFVPFCAKMCSFVPLWAI